MLVALIYPYQDVSASKSVVVYQYQCVSCRQGCRQHEESIINSFRSERSAFNQQSKVRPLFLKLKLKHCGSLQVSHQMSVLPCQPPMFDPVVCSDHSPPKDNPCLVLLISSLNPSMFNRIFVPYLFPCSCSCLFILG